MKISGKIANEMVILTT